MVQHRLFCGKNVSLKIFMSVVNMATTIGLAGDSCNSFTLNHNCASWLYSSSSKSQFFTAEISMQPRGMLRIILSLETGWRNRKIGRKTWHFGKLLYLSIYVHCPHDKRSLIRHQRDNVTRLFFSQFLDFIFNYFICTVFTERSAAPQTTLWRGPGRT